MNAVYQFLLTHLWESSLFGVACGLLMLALGRSWSFSRHLLAWSAILKFLIPFSALAWIFEWAKELFIRESSDSAAVAPYMGSLAELLQVNYWLEIESVEASSAAPFPWSSAMLVVWVVGFIAITYFWIRQYLRVRASIVAECEEADCGWGMIAERVWDKPRERMPQLLVCGDENIVAGVFGIRRLAVIIPSSFSTSFNEAEREAFLRHEFQHIYKRDNLWLFIQKFIRNLFWIHPLVWWLDFQISAEREIMRDEEVIRKTRNVTSYLNCLMKVSNIKLPRSYATSVGIKGSPFARRVKAIGRIRTSRLTDWLSAVGSVAAVLALTAFLSSALAIPNLQADEGGERREMNMEELKGEIQEIARKVETKGGHLEEYASELESRKKRGGRVSEDEQGRLQELRRELDYLKEELEKKVGRLHRASDERADRMAQEMQELERRLSDDHARFENREMAVERLEELRHKLSEDRYYEDEERQRYGDDDNNPHYHDSEGEIVERVMSLRDDQDAALDLVYSSLNDDSSAALYFLAGSIHAEREENDRAMDFYKVALDKAPNYRKAAKNLGFIQMKIGNLDAAKESFLKTLSLGNEDGRVNGFLGVCYMEAGDGVTAEYHFRRAVRQMPETRDWRQGLATSLEMQGKMDQAEETMKFVREMRDDEE